MKNKTKTENKQTTESEQSIKYAHKNNQKRKINK